MFRSLLSASETAAQVRSCPSHPLLQSASHFPGPRAQLFLDASRRHPIGDLGIPPFGLLNLTSGDAVVELMGDEGAGKSELVLHAMVNCVLPKTWRTFRMGGAEASVVFFDCDCRFSILRFLSVLEARIRALTTSPDEQSQPAGVATPAATLATSEYDQVVRECLARVFVLRCSTSLELLASVQSLWGLIDMNESIRLVVFESIASLYWLDGLTATDRISENALTQKGVVRLVKKLLHDFSGLTVLATKPTLFYKKDELVPRDYMDREWQQLVTHRFVVHVLSKPNASSSSLPRQTVSLILLSPPNTSVPSFAFDILGYGCEFH
eukprot:m.28052 g.28052  ORF g.28052 m.28052 type:complete len:324 (+) comp39998_c0_seq1:113-1084(+)